MENMADMFVFETGDLLEKLDEILMRTEQEDSISSDDINEIFRTMHTIKGSAAMMSMHNMSTLAHSVEDLFYIIREDPAVKYDKPALYELLFSASDNLKSELDSLYDDAPLTDFSELENKIHAFAATMKGQPAQKSAPEKSAPKPAQPANAVPKKHAEKHEQSMISVKLDKLNRLLDLVAEIVITEGSVISSPDLKKAEINLDRFNKSSRELKKLTDELQDVVMSIRMVPVSTAFQKMNRVVRDMNQKLKKNVTLVFEGQETEVDKSIVDILNDPLMHIVRNAVDHGIEDPEVRAKAGKTEPATVTLSAGYDSNEVVISCRDNGAGMDTAKLMAKAKKNGMLTKPENEYTDKEIFNFVVAAGFSTNDKITEYSGRGVGMDVVKKNLEKVGGKLYVDSKFGEGSVFTIRIPLSLSILDVLSVDVGGENFSLPVSAVSEAFSCKAESFITDPEGNEFIMLREKCLPLIRMSDHFDIPNAEKDVTKGIMLCCKDGGKEAVLMADRITVDQQVVVKPFSPLLDAYPLKESGMAGCSVLGDGSITIILDMKEFLGNYDFRKGE
jgi:two-component system chemotaxis sensor kinase CheA